MVHTAGWLLLTGCSQSVAENQWVDFTLLRSDHFQQQQAIKTIDQQATSFQGRFAKIPKTDPRGGEEIVTEHHLYPHLYCTGIITMTVAMNDS